MPEAGAVESNTIKQVFHFGEFMRVELDGTWYRASDYLNWYIQEDIKMSGGQWIDQGCSSGSGNP